MKKTIKNILENKLNVNVTMGKININRHNETRTITVEGQEARKAMKYLIEAIEFVGVDYTSLDDYKVRIRVKETYEWVDIVNSLDACVPKKTVKVENTVKKASDSLKVGMNITPFGVCYVTDENDLKEAKKFVDRVEGFVSFLFRK